MRPWRSGWSAPSWPVSVEIEARLILSDHSAICREGFGHSRAQALVGSTPPPVKLGEYQRRSPAPHFLNVSQEPRRDHYRMHGDAALRCAALELFPIAR